MRKFCKRHMEKGQKMTFTIAGAMPRKLYNESRFDQRFQNLYEDCGLMQVQPAEDGAEARGQWKRLQRIATLPAREQNAVVLLIHSSVVSRTLRNNTGMPTGVCHGR